MPGKFGIAAIGSIVLIWAGAGHGQDADLFSFVPPGGRTILIDLFDAGLPDAVRQEIEAGGKSGAEWLAYLEDQAAVDPGLGQLDGYQLQTLADYLAYNAPIAGGTGTDVLPPDGRDLTLTYCQSCHIITVVVTQDRAREAWLGTMNKPSHVGVDLTPQQREALADYLVVNGGIPIEEVPPELRAGGASY